MKYNKEFFLEYFSNINEEDIIESYQTHSLDKAKHCSLGWLKEDNNNSIVSSSNSEMANCLESLLFHNNIKSSSYPKGRTGNNICCVNNGNHPKYSQPTPKKRILAAISAKINLSK